jgi:hypothetical protein
MLGVLPARGGPRAHGPVHGSRIQVNIVQAAGQHLAHRALSRSSRAIDGYDLQALDLYPVPSSTEKSHENGQHLFYLLAHPHTKINGILLYFGLRIADCGFFGFSFSIRIPHSEFPIPSIPHSEFRIPNSLENFPFPAQREKI